MRDEALAVEGEVLMHSTMSSLCDSNCFGAAKELMSN